MTRDDGGCHPMRHPMQQALAEAKAAFALGEAPVGAVVVDGLSGRVLSSVHNRTQSDSDPTAHAELLAIREAAGKVGSARLLNCDLYVTLEPCPMCAGAIAQARIRRLYYGAYDPKGGGVDHGPCLFQQSACHHRPEVYGGLYEEEAASLLKTFFKRRRAE